jgi:hypothetical protein
VQRPGLCETRTLCWSKRDSNRWSLSRRCHLIIAEEKGLQVDQGYLKGAIAFHGGTSGSEPPRSAGESNSRVNFATCRKDVGVRDDGVPGPAHALRSHCEGNVPRSRLYAPLGGLILQNGRKWVSCKITIVREGTGGSKGISFCTALN